MRQKEFARLAIENGYTGDRCEGWDWIKGNISELDYVFQTEEYKGCEGYTSNCMPILLGAGEYIELEERALKTAWYLNSKREQKIKEDNKIKELKEHGFVQIESNEKLDGRKIEFIIDSSGEMFGGMQKYSGKLKWASVDKRLMAMKAKHTRTGFWVDSCNHKVYVKIQQ